MSRLDLPVELQAARAALENWERAYRRQHREYEVLPRSGLRRGHRLMAWWHATDDWPTWLAAIFEPLLARLACLVHNHSPMTEMDNTTIVCSVCGERLGLHHDLPGMLRCSGCRRLTTRLEASARRFRARRCAHCGGQLQEAAGG